MSIRSALGPVFALEAQLAARRWQMYATRSLFVGAILVSMSVVAYASVNPAALTTIRAQAMLGESFYAAIVGTQFILVLLAAPAATAGSICLDKARGTLAHLLVTDLSNTEIILGKLAARLCPVFGLVGCTLPILAIGTLLGGIDPVGLTGAFLVTLGVAAVGCSLALLLSVWGRKTHEVLLATYSLLLLWTFGSAVIPLIPWAAGYGWWTLSLPGEIDPTALIFSAGDAIDTAPLVEEVRFLAVTWAAAALLTATAIWRLRAVATREDGPRRRPVLKARLRARWWAESLPGPALDPNPVLWREWHRNRPTRWGRVLWRIYGVAAVVITLLILGAVASGNRNQREAGAMLFGGQVAVGFLLMSVVAATPLAEERMRGSLDVLLATPIPTRAIVWGKWWGTYRNVIMLCLLPSITACAHALYELPWLTAFLAVPYLLAFGAALTSLGLAVATWTPRLGRAVGVTVTAYVLVTVGWFLLVLIAANGGSGSSGPGLASGSPFFGPTFALVVNDIPTSYQDRIEFGGWIVFWILFYMVMAAVFLAATLASFDRCLGRVPEPRLPVRPVRPVAKPAGVVHLLD